MVKQLLAATRIICLIFCLGIVIWQLIVGTEKYLAAPVANYIYTAEAELPALTICHQNRHLRVHSKYGLDYKNFKDGKFVPTNTKDFSIEEEFEDGISKFYYLLDYTGFIFILVDYKYV